MELAAPSVADAVDAAVAAGAEIVTIAPYFLSRCAPLGLAWWWNHRLSFLCCIGSFLSRLLSLSTPCRELCCTQEDLALPLTYPHQSRFPGAVSKCVALHCRIWH